MIRLLVFVALCLWGRAALAQEQWDTYSNPRFGATAEYPADLFTVQEPPPENGDGQTFHTADGRAELTIYGTNNLHSEEPQAYVQHNVSLCDVTYKKIGADFYAVFGTPWRDHLLRTLQLSEYGCAELLLRLLPSCGEGQVGHDRDAHRPILAFCSEGLPMPAPRAPGSCARCLP